MSVNISFFISDVTCSGGTERVLSSLVNELVNNYRGASITVFSLYKRHERPYYDFSPKIKICYLSDKKSLVRSILELRESIKKYKYDYIVDVDSILTFYTAFIKLTLLFTSVMPKIITWEHFHANVNLGTKRRDLGRYLATKFSHQVIVLTDEDKEQWLNKFFKKGANKSKIRRIYNLNYKTEIREQKSVHTDRPIFFCAGRLVEQKGFDLAILAWKKMLDENEFDVLPVLKIAGKGKNEHLLKKQIIDLQLCDSVELLGEVSDIAYYYRHAYAYILSSRFEGFGLTILEAMAFSVPVISFACPCGPRDIIADEYGILVEHMDTDKLAQEMAMLVNDKNKRNDLAKKAYMRVSDFKSSVIIRQWAKVFNL